MIQEINDIEAKKYGVETKHEIMDNGEKRFRLLFKDGSSYVRTESSDYGMWQNSHFHNKIKEIYIVQQGWIIFVELIEGEAIFKKILAGQFIFSKPNIPHNIYVPINTSFHTVKYGDTAKTIDWISSPELDALTKIYDEKVALGKCTN